MEQWIANQDFWKSSTEDAFMDAYSTMEKAGMKKDAIEETLDEIKSAMAGEYGD